MKVLVTTKLRREIEPKWVSLYIKEYYPDAEITLRCPLGPIPDELKNLYGPAKAARVYRPSRPEVDAVVITPDELVLIEAKIFKYREGLGALLVYKSLINSTPEFQPLLPRRISMHLLLPREIPWVMAAAPDLGIEIKTFSPEWVLRIWEERDKYWTPSAKMAREERKALLEKLGFV